MELRAEKIKKEFLRESRGTNVFEAVRETDFVLRSGELTLLRGRSGSGKSTFLNMMSGILEPTSGSVLMDGRNLYEMDDNSLSELRNRSFGYIPQGQSAIRSLTVMENVLLPFSLFGEEPESPEFARFLLDEMGIMDLADVLPAELSGGEMRRMSIARALVRRLEFVFADEPTGDLDDENTEMVLGMLKKASDKGASVLLVSHEPGAEAFADRVCVMKGGVLEE